MKISWIYSIHNIIETYFRERIGNRLESIFYNPEVEIGRVFQDMNYVPEEVLIVECTKL